MDSVFKMGKNYYPYVFLEECKFIVKEKEVSKYNNENLENSSNSNESDKE